MPNLQQAIARWRSAWYTCMYFWCAISMVLILWVSLCIYKNSNKRMIFATLCKRAGAVYPQTVSMVQLTIKLMLLQTNVLNFVLGTFLIHPKSRLVPDGVQVNFTCKIEGGRQPYWNVGIKKLATPQTRQLLRSQGYVVTEEVHGNAETLTLTVNVTADKNNTELYCSSLFTHSNSAYLYVISGTILYVQQNDLLATHYCDRL